MQENNTVSLIKGRAGIIPSCAVTKGNMYTVTYTVGVVNKIKIQKGFLEFVSNSIVRHASGDWGNLDQEDKEWNDKHPSAAMSVYEYGEDERIWVKTELDRIIVLLPEEY